jgi:hypothetical protein
MTAPVYCQSCAMPMKDSDRGTETDGRPSGEYCSYCYQHGRFTVDCTMAQMIDRCVKPMVEFNPGMTEAKARAMMVQIFPQLKRWKK